jgi:hypothetical protein
VRQSARTFPFEDFQNERRGKMIVDRLVLSAKPGRELELVELIKAERARFPSPHDTRLYFWPRGHPMSQVVYEVEFESYAESESFWAEWNADPETATFYEKLYELLTESGFSDETWTLAE